MNKGGVVEVNHKQTEEHLRVCYKTKLPLFIWGTTGIGKSDTVKKVAEDLNVEVVDVRISQLDPSDLRGLPKYTDAGDTTKWLPPDWLPKENPELPRIEAEQKAKIEEAEKTLKGEELASVKSEARVTINGARSRGILFLDELNLAPPSIQASAYQLILDRKIGSYNLPEGWMVVGAGNRAEDRANVFAMAAPLRNRLLQIQLKVPTVEEWTNWALEHEVDVDIVAYLSWKSDHLHTLEKDEDASVFATPRSWYFASRVIKAGGAERKQLVGSCVGYGIALELEAFKKLHKKIKLSEIIENPKLVREIKAVDVKYVLVSALSSKYMASREMLVPILNVANHMDAEFGILLSRMLKRGNKNFKADFKKLARKEDKIVKAFIEKYYKFISDDDIKEA